MKKLKSRVRLEHFDTMQINTLSIAVLSYLMFKVGQGEFKKERDGFRKKITVSLTFEEYKAILRQLQVDWRNIPDDEDLNEDLKKIVEQLKFAEIGYQAPYCGAFWETVFDGANTYSKPKKASTIVEKYDEDKFLEKVEFEFHERFINILKVFYIGKKETGWVEIIE